MSVQRRLLLTNVFAVILPLLLFGTLLFNITMGEIDTSVRRTYNQNLAQVDVSLNESFRQLKKIHFGMYNNPRVAAYLQVIAYPWSHNEVDRVNSYQEAVAALEEICWQHDDIWSVSVVGIWGESLTVSQNGVERSNIDVLNDPYFEPLKSSTGDIVILPSHTVSYYFSEDRQVFTIACRYFDMSFGEHPGTNNYTGYILVECDASLLHQICSHISLGENGNIIILDDNDHILYSTQPVGNADLKTLEVFTQSDELSDNVKKNDKSNLVISRKSAHTDWTILGIIPSNEVSRWSRQIGTNFWLLCALCMVAISAASWFSSRQIVLPILELHRVMREFENGNMRVRTSSQRKDEIGELSRRFNRLADAVNRLNVNIHKAEAKKREAELCALCNQINPHFLYNVLDTIRMMAIMDNSQQVADALESAAGLFRFTISKLEEFISLSDEMSCVHNYIDLQMLRYRHRFHVRMNIESGIESCKMPKLSLQPIVENAIIHGFENTLEGGLLEISIHREGQRIVFLVRDNGNGIEPEKLSALKQLMNDGENSDSVGLTNIHQRLILYFGAESGLDIHSIPGQGTSVRFSIPYILDLEEIENRFVEGGTE